jgi:hypothetical protein
MADVKYPDYTPVDEPIRTGPKPAEPGSGIKVEKEPKPMPAPKPVKKMASGGSASSRGDGCAQRGKTKGTIVMCGGGMAKGKK